MTDQVFKFPGFFDREIDLTARVSEPVGIPAGVIGAAKKGPAFVPVTLGSFSDFITKFGDVDSKLAAPYAVEKFLQNKTALTFVRVLGAGVNATSADFETTRTKGTVKNAGFLVSGTVAPGDTRQQGAVQFLVAKHQLTGSETYGMPMFSDNGSFLQTGSIDEVNLVRGEIFTAYDTRIMILSHNESWSLAADDAATVSASNGTFKLVVSTSQGATFGSDDGNAGVRIYTASLDPTSDLYFAKLLNRDPSKFETERHFLYADFAVDNEIAHVSTGSNAVVIASGSANTSTTSGDTALIFRNAFGKFDTRYKTPRTPWFISQPFGSTEHNLFYIEALDDGEYSNTQVKISIVNMVASTNPRNPYGTFSILVRLFNDTDLNPAIIEQFSNVTLDPNSDFYIGKVIGDTKTHFNFDVENPDDRRLIKEGKYANRSKYIRVVINEQVELQQLPASSLPFGFRGPEVLNTNSLLGDLTGSGGFSSVQRLAAMGTIDPRLLASVLPPLPYRFKVTRGQISTGSGQLSGAPGSSEITDARFYWGVKFERNNNDILNTNVNGELNQLVPALTKFPGIALLDVPVTGTYTDKFNNNKFTLARVALGNTAFTDITASANIHMKEACYIRNGTPDVTQYKITDGSTTRLTLASLIHSGTQATLFNKFTDYAKFTTCLFGGFDGVNIMDSHAAAFDDRSTSTEARGSIIGGSNSAFSSPGFQFNQNGVGINNNQINSYRVATDIITDPIISNINLLVAPGQRDPFVTDYVSDAVSNFGLAMFLMDIPVYNSDSDRVFDGETANSSTYLDVENTADSFESRALDNTFVAPYFPDVVIDDTRTGRKVTVPASVAALSALSFNDKVAYPWFAPAGFNRAALNFVSLTRTRLKQSERERMYQVRVNPIVKFPNEGYVIFSQKTLDAAGTALDSINVQRMVIDVQRQIIDIGNRLIWEQITPDLYTEFVSKVTPVLANVQNRGGLQQFKVVCDSTNNSDLDRENNKINAKIFLLPVKAVEFVAIDFIISRNGVQIV